IIHKGELIYEEMRKNKIDINEIQQLLRGKDVFAIQEVEYASMETNGETSVLKKSQFDNPTREDMKIVPTKEALTSTLLNHDEINHDNLEENERTETWLQNELRKQNFEKVEVVFYAEYIKDKPLFIQHYIKIKHKDYKTKKQ